jgi:hypothetical protein
MWLATLDLDVRTVENYRSRLRCHLLPSWGEITLGEISTLRAVRRDVSCARAMRPVQRT